MIYSWKKIVRNGLPLLTVCVFIEIFAGQILQGKQETLLLFPIFLISIPVINGVGGNIGSVLGARLASGLHVGYISIDLKDKEMHENLLISVLLGVITYLILSFIIYCSYYVLSFYGNVPKHLGLLEFVSIVLGAGILLVCVVSIACVFTAFWSFKKGLDPDDMVAPVVTTVGDVMGIVFLFLWIGLVGL